MRYGRSKLLVLFENGYKTSKLSSFAPILLATRSNAFQKIVRKRKNCFARNNLVEFFFFNSAIVFLTIFFLLNIIWTPILSTKSTISPKLKIAKILNSVLHSFQNIAHLLGRIFFLDIFGRLLRSKDSRFCKFWEKIELNYYRLCIDFCIKYAWFIVPEVFTVCNDVYE